MERIYFTRPSRFEGSSGAKMLKPSEKYRVYLIRPQAQFIKISEPISRMVEATDMNIPNS